MVKVKSVKKHEKKEGPVEPPPPPVEIKKSMVKKPKKPPDQIVENGLPSHDESAQNGAETPDDIKNVKYEHCPDMPLDLAKSRENDVKAAPVEAKLEAVVGGERVVEPKSPPRLEKSPPRIEKSPPRFEKTPPRLEKSPPRLEESPPRTAPSPPSGGRSPAPLVNGDLSDEDDEDDDDEDDDSHKSSSPRSLEPRLVPKPDTNGELSYSSHQSRDDEPREPASGAPTAPLWNNSLSSLEQLLNQPTAQEFPQSNDLLSPPFSHDSKAHTPPSTGLPRPPSGGPFIRTPPSGGGGFVCDKCGFVSKSQAGVNKHKGRVHSDKNEKFVAAHPFKCPMCEYRGKRLKQVRDHIQCHNTECCSYCLFTGSAEEIARHVERDHASRPYKTCHVCSKSMDMDDDHFQIHVTSCDGQKQIFTCELCPKSFNFKINLKQHEQTHDKEMNTKRFQCDDCDYETSYKANLLKHIENRHASEKPKLTCPVCQKLYHNEMALKRHVKTHSEKPGHICPQCEKVFEGVRGLKEHLHEVHNCYMYPCEVMGCDKTFKSRKAVRNHCAEYHGMADKKYKCDYEGCSMEFFRSSHLSRHKRTHSDEREFSCTWPECGKAFRHADNLKVHYRKHTNDRRYTCPECEYTCTQRHVLNGHVRRHHQAGSIDTVGDYEYADSEEDTDETLILADVLDSNFSDSTLMKFAEEFMRHWDNEKSERSYPGLEEVFNNLDLIDLDQFVWVAEDIDDTLAVLTLDGIRRKKRGRPRLEEIGAVSATVRRKRSQAKEDYDGQYSGDYNFSGKQKRPPKPRFLDPDRIRNDQTRKVDPSVYDFNSDEETGGISMQHHQQQHHHQSQLHQQQHQHQQQPHQHQQQQQQQHPDFGNNMMMQHHPHQFNYHHNNNAMSGGKMQQMVQPGQMGQQQPPQQQQSQQAQQQAQQQPGKLLSQALTRPLDQMTNMTMQMGGYSGPPSEPQDIASNIPPIMSEVQTSCPNSLSDGSMFDHQIQPNSSPDLFCDNKSVKAGNENEIIDQHLLQKYLEDTNMEDFERDLIKNEKPSKSGEFDQYMGTEPPVEAPGSIGSGQNTEPWKNQEPKSISSAHSSSSVSHEPVPYHDQSMMAQQSPMVSKPPSVQSEHQQSQDFNPSLPTYDRASLPGIPQATEQRDSVYGPSYLTTTPPMCSSANNVSYNDPLQLLPASRPLENPLSSLAMSTAKYLESEMSKTRVYSNQGWTLQETQSLRLTHSLLGREQWPPTPEASYPYLSDRDPYSAGTDNRVPPYFPPTPESLDKPTAAAVAAAEYDMAARYLNPGLPPTQTGFPGYSKPAYDPTPFRQPLPDYRQMPTPDLYASMAAADKYAAQFYPRDPYSGRVHPGMPTMAENPFLHQAPAQYPTGRDYAREYNYPRYPPQPGTGYPGHEPTADFFMRGPAPPQDPYRPMVYNMMNRYYQ